MAYLQVENLTKKFDNTEVLKGIFFSMEKGEVLSIIGSSGGGKTTLLRCINFLDLADGGKMSLDGDIIFNADEVKNYSVNDLRKKRLNFGLVFQSFNLFPQYTATENITLAPTLLLSDEVKEMTANHKAALCKLKKQISLSKATNKNFPSLSATIRNLKKLFPKRKKLL